MKACYAIEGLPVWQKVPTPQPNAGQLLVKVTAAALNRADLAQVAGHYPPPPGESEILGLEISGEIVAIGADVCGWSVGDAVLALVGGGAYAEYCLVDAVLAVRRPDVLDPLAAAAIPEVWMTVWRNLVEIGQLQAGQRVLIHAGASGIGAAGIQLAKSLGAWVAVTTSSAQKQDFCRLLGADCVIDYRSADFSTVLREAGGVDLILDTVGGDYLAGNQRCLNRDGKIILIGMLRSRLTEIDMGTLLVKRQQLIGSTLRSLPLADKARLADALSTRILPGFVRGQFKPALDRVFPASAVREAHAYMAANRNLGKIVLDLAS